MDNRERAEKIIRDKKASWVLTDDLKAINSFDWTQLIEILASQLDEAVREAIAEIHPGCDLAEGFKDGFAAAREKAAGIVKYSSIKDLDELAERIRVLRPKED